MKPILFNTEMVKAILEGRKTVTRRLVKQKYSNTHLEIFTNKYGTRLIELQNNVEGETFGKNSDGTSWQKLLGMREVEYDHKPYHRGDIIYVRETFVFDNEKKKYIYKASEETYNHIGTHDDIIWHPSIHMPKEAARIFLRVKDVRVERLQDMEHDVPRKEGIREYTKDGEIYKYAVSADWWADYHSKHRKEFRGTYWQDMPKNPTIAFSYLWNSTIPKKDPGQMYKYGWNANPWVWVIEFETISKVKALQR